MLHSESGQDAHQNSIDGFGERFLLGVNGVKMMNTQKFGPTLRGFSKNFPKCFFRCSKACLIQK